MARSEPASDRPRAFGDSGAYTPHLALLAVQVLFGTWPIFGKIAILELPGAGLVLIRIGAAACAFFLLRGRFTFEPVRPRADYLRLAFYSFLGIAANQTLFVLGLARTTVVNTAVLATTIPIFAMIVSVALGRERLTRMKLLGVALAAAGALYLIDPLRGGFSGHTAFGDLLIILNCLCYGSFLALSPGMLRKYGTFTVIFWLFAFGTLLTLPLGAYQLSSISLGSVHAKTWGAVAYIILLPTVGAYYLNAWALKRVAPSIVATYVYLQPLVVFAVAPLVLGEKLNAKVWVAALVIFSGVAFVTRGSGRERGAESETAE